MLQANFYRAACLVWDFCYEKQYKGSLSKVFEELATIGLMNPTPAETPAEAHQYLLERLTAHHRRKTGVDVPRRHQIANLILTDYHEGSSTSPGPIKQILLIGAEAETDVGNIFITLNWSTNKLQLSIREPRLTAKDPLFEFTFKEDCVQVTTHPKKYSPIQPMVAEFILLLDKLLFDHQRQALRPWMKSLTTPF